MSAIITDSAGNFFSGWTVRAVSEANRRDGGFNEVRFEKSVPQHRLNKQIGYIAKEDRDSYTHNSYEYRQPVPLPCAGFSWADSKKPKAPNIAVPVGLVEL